MLVWLVSNLHPYVFGTRLTHAPPGLEPKPEDPPEPKAENRAGVSHRETRKGPSHLFRTVRAFCRNTRVKTMSDSLVTASISAGGSGGTTISVLANGSYSATLQLTGLTNPLFAIVTRNGGVAGQGGVPGPSTFICTVGASVTMDTLWRFYNSGIYGYNTSTGAISLTATSFLITPNGTYAYSDGWYIVIG